MSWTVMWSGGPRSTAAVIAAVLEGKRVIAYNICGLGEDGHLQEIERAWRKFDDFITPIYFELSDNVRCHGRNVDLVALMTYPAYIYARDYTPTGHQGIIYGRLFESRARDKLKVKGVVDYGPGDEEEVVELLEEIGLTPEDTCFE